MVIFPRHIATVLATAAVVFGFAWSAQKKLAGEKPTGHFQSMAEPPSASLSPELKKLVEAARSRPDDLAGWKILTGALVRELQSAERPSTEIIFESMDALTNVLRLNPKDPDALIAFADLSFNQQVFDKAIGLYERYLTEQPEDLSARSRYASSLAFVQRYPDAVKELRAVLTKDPANFHAAAYLAITYAQMGEKSEALATGERALTLAPSDEARARFSDFLKTVKSDPPSEPAALRKAEPAVVQFLKNNPIAGPKFDRFEERGGELKVFFRDFPMEQMPPFAKDKFLGGVKGAAQGLSSVVFIDASSGKQLERLDLTK
jgi:tetratricopeptide (TPR) repeat protein